jgi:hypothetical protein
MVKEIGPLDLIVDDGSHVNGDQITTFKTLFPHLNPGGYYVIEDLQTSYWPGFGGNSEDLRTSDTTVGYLKSLVDGLNHEELVGSEKAIPSYTDRHITAISFYHALAIVEKGMNAEGSAGAMLPDKIKFSGLPKDQSQVRPDQW